MLKRMTCVGACLLVAVIAHAQNKTYTVREGDNLSVIAKRVGVKQATLAKLNKLSNVHQLKPGTTLRIPTSAHLSSASAVWSKGGYVVRNGENDWTIAKKLKVSISKLHASNPNINWSRLQPGQVLKTPGGAGKTAAVASKTAAKAKPLAKGGYVVKDGDNDWTIARRYKITPSKLHALNPSVTWTRIKPGDRLAVPGTKAMVASIPSIRTRHAVINTDGVTIRRGPGIDSQAITLVDASTQVTVLDKDGGWYKLKFPKGTVGWVRGDFLKPISATREAQSRVAAKKAKNKLVKSSSKVASTNRSTTRTAPRGHRSKGYTKTVTMASLPAGVRGDLLSTAKSLLGTRYRYGSTNPSRGLDCSGFALTAYKSVGVKLPRTSSQQSRVGQAVGKTGLSKGDLVFFATRGGRRVGHVGIYVGDGKFIHASSGGGRVRVDSLNEGYYKRRYVGARRVKGGTTVASRGSSRGSRSATAKKDEPKAVASKPEETKKVDAAPKEVAAPPTPPNTRGADEIGK